MHNISSVSIKALVIVLISSFSFVAIGLAWLIGGQFQQAAFDSKAIMSSEFIEVAAEDAFEDLDKVLFDLGSELQSDKVLRKQFKSVMRDDAPASELSSTLNEPFSRRYQTAGLIDIEKIRAFDKDLNFIASSSKGKTGFDGTINKKLKDTTLARKGAAKLKMSSRLWANGMNAYYSKLIPIGGLRVSGYIEVIVNPSHNLKIIESILKAPIAIQNVKAQSVYKSNHWPENLRQFVVAEYVYREREGGRILSIKAVFDNSSFLEKTNMTRNIYLAVFVIITIVTAIISIFFMNMTTFKPFKSLIEEMQQASNGNLLVEIDNYGIKEAHVLSNSLKEFVTSLRENVNIILNNSANLYDSATHLSAASEKNRVGIDCQQNQIEQVATAMNEMNATVAEVEKNTAEAALAANNSQEKSILGKETVGSVINTINHLSETIQESESLIEKLNEESKAIGSILDVITSISEQTNLLALNAAIEAARAGEAGRGFAVVADEVRTLATKTQDSASDIRNMVESLQNGTLGAVNSMETSRTTADKAVDEINVAGQAIDEVSASVSLMSDINTQIATAAEEQSAVVEEINKNVVKIRDIGIDNTEIATETAEGGIHLVQVAETLKDSVKNFKVM